MKKIINILLILTIMAFTAVKADAVVLKDYEIKPAIEQKVVENYKNFTDAKVEAYVVALPFKDMILPNGKINFQVSSNTKKFVTRDLYQVEVFVNGKAYKIFNAPITVKAFEDVLVASTTIPRERALTINDVRLERKDISNNIKYALKEQDLSRNLVAKKYFVEGELIDSRFVKDKPAISRNSNVTVMFNTEDLTVSIEGTALSDGSVGDDICIMSKAYNKIYKGTVIGENKVLVKI